jgi:hypothetical protein
MFVYVTDYEGEGGWAAGIGYGGSADTDSATDTANEVKATAAQTAHDTNVAQFIQVSANMHFETASILATKPLL